VLRLRLTRSGHCATAPASIWCCGRAMWRGLTPRQPAAR
jgi:hypothetical protein